MMGMYSFFPGDPIKMEIKSRVIKEVSVKVACVYMTNMLISLSFPIQFQPICAIIRRELDFLCKHASIYGICADEKKLEQKVIVAHFFLFFRSITDLPI